MPERSPINRLWGIDPGAPGGISPLPASPLLFPAMLVVGAFMAVVGAVDIWQRATAGEKTAPAGVPRSTYERFRRRYHELTQKKYFGEGLTAQESYELHSVIQLPPWSPDVPYHY